MSSIMPDDEKSKDVNDCGCVSGKDDLEKIKELLSLYQEKYRLLTEHMMDVVWQAAPDLIITYVSSSVKKLLGYEPHEVEGRHLSGLLTPEAQKLVSERYPIIMLSLTETGKSDSEVYEVQQIRKDGSTVWTEVVTVPAFNTSGQFIGFQGVTRDASKRKEQEDALRANEEKYRELVESISDVIFEINSEGVLTYISPVVRNVMGFEPEDVIGKTFMTFVLPEDRELLDKRFLELMEGIEHPAEYRLLGKQGDIRHVRTFTKPIWKQGLFNGARGTLIDITDRIKNEQALQNSEQTLKTILDTSPAGIVLLQDRRCIWINEFGLKMLGYDSEKELVGQRSRIIYASQEEYEKVGKEFYQDMDKSRIVQVTAKMCRKDSSIFDGKIRIKHVDAASPEKVVIGVFSDISEELEAQKEKQALQVQYLQAQKMEAIGNLTGGICHDFENLLQVILGYTELILSDKELLAKNRSQVRAIESACEKGVELVKSLLTFSRKGKVILQPINLNQRVEQLTRILARLIPAMIQIQIELAPDLPIINADATQIDQVIMNLAINSRDAIDGVGVITIGTKNVIVDDVHSSAHVGLRPGVYTLLTVSDNGCGMNKQTVGRIFEPFYTTKEMGKGTGLGLATVYWVVQQHNGSISCRSEPGEGTTFSIYFPAIGSQNEAFRN